jgi:hypothetical protein
MRSQKTEQRRPDHWLTDEGGRNLPQRQSPGGRIASASTGSSRTRWFEQELLRKEVIQPHLPVRLPCYDFTPITDPTFDSSLLAVGPLASGVTDFRGVTGGVYKARERIHPGVADPGLLATPTSWSRVADSNPN